MGLNIAAIVVLTCLLVNRRLNAARKRQRMLTWPSTKAVLEQDQDFKLREPQKELLLAEPFGYYVNGEAKSGDRIMPAAAHLTSHDRNMVRFELMRQPETRVFFNSENHEEAFLLPGSAPVTWLRLVVYCLLGIVGPLLLLLYLTS